MKRHHRKHVLDINSDSSSKKSNKFQRGPVHPNQDNGVPSNPLTNLLEQYNSESEDEDKQGQGNSDGRLDKKVDDFLKEIQYIAPKAKEVDDAGNINVANDNSVPLENTSGWQECIDESTGYPYYWHTKTNQVTWELPKELASTCKKVQSANLPRPPFDSQRNFGSNTYPEMQANIPDGMIPKEVVARNRNKQVNPPSNLKKTPSGKGMNLNHSTDDDMNDGKIEMITSFGSDESDSDESIEENSKGKISPDPSSSEPKPPVELTKRKAVRMGPSLPEFRSSAFEKSAENSEDTSDNGNDDSNERRLVNEEQCNESPLNIFNDKEPKFSLVPGYADDSENEEDHTNDKPVVKTLFPISDYTEKEKEANPSISSEKLDNHNADSTDSLADETQVPFKPEDNVSKINKFLESSEVPSKAFKRKRRIAFDVIPNKTRIPEIENNAPNSITNQSKPELIRSNDERLGFGFPKQSSSKDTEEHPISTENPSSDHQVEKSDAGISFIRGETLNLLASQNEMENVEKKDESERLATIKETEGILEKLKFLSEGCQVASAVQIMTIQLQTLLGAWEARDLKDRYLDNWLKGTSRELSRLEEAAAPPGWDCQWDRSHKRYYYRNESSGETRWNYPDVIGGAEEMELCTTPPLPTEQDGEDFGEEKSSETVNQEVLDRTADQEQNSKTPESENHGNSEKAIDEDKVDMKNNEEKTQDESDPPVPPPPPQISSPSPPPPPKIYPDDLRQEKKRKANDLLATSSTNSKNNKIEKASDKFSRTSDPMTKGQPAVSIPLAGTNHAEPLPPGVDSPEISYSMTGTSMEPTVIFAATPQQTNASLYAAAALQDPTNVSIIGHHHHHQALLQSQLVHYPAYHHLHNQALIAAANRLTSQDGVQFVLDFPRIYTNTQVIAKPPMKSSNETMGSALDSFYSDIASMERQPVEQVQYEISPVPNLTEQQVQVSTLLEAEKAINDAAMKEKKKKKAKFVVSKKQKQVSSMVAKWQKAQNYEDTN